MESIKVQYTDPSDGLDKYEIVKFDIMKFRKDDSVVPSEDFFFTSTVGSTVTLREIPDLTEASIVANPKNPYGCSTVVYGLVKTKPTGGATALELTQNPQKLGFVANEPCVILASFDATTPLGYVTPNNVTTTSLEFASAVPSGILQNGIVVKLPIPKAISSKFDKQLDNWGAKSMLEKPNAPTIDATPGSGSISVTVTAPTTKAGVIKKYDIFIISAAADPDFDPMTPIFAGNRKADLSLSPGTTIQGVATTFGGGANAGGGTIVNGTYYVVAVAKDADSDMNVNCSALSNIDEVTVSY